MSMLLESDVNEFCKYQHLDKVVIYLIEIYVKALLIAINPSKQARTFWYNAAKLKTGTKDQMKDL